MDIYHFVKERLDVIRFFYETAVLPFTNIMRKIENYEEPYDQPPGYESGEPPFMEEWSRSNDCVEVLGHSCLALLQVALKLYLDEYRKEVEQYWAVEWHRREKHSGRGGWFSGYRDMFQETLGVDWGDSGVDLGVLEQIALARDDIFHHSHIVGIFVRQSKKHFEKYQESFFADEREVQMAKKYGKGSLLVPTWTIRVSGEKLMQAIETVDQFCRYMEDAWGSWARRE